MANSNPNQRLDVEDDDARQHRIGSLLEQLNSLRGENSATSNAPNAPALPGSRPSLDDLPVYNDLLNRIQAFLPQLKAENDALAERIRADPRSADIENVDEDERVIEMDLGLGVFESRNPGEASESSTDDEDDEDDEDEDMDSSSSSASSDESDSDSESSGSEDPSSSDANSDVDLEHAGEPRPIRPLPRRASGRPTIEVIDEKINNNS